MATTYALIASYTADTTVSSITFNSIPNTYTDLKLIFSGRSSSTGGNQYEIQSIRMNSISSNYSNKVLDNYNGLSSYTNFNGITNAFILGVVPRNDATANTFSNGEIWIPNYASSSYKKIVMSNSISTQMTTTLNMYDANLSSSLQQSTAAISSLEIAGISWVSGSQVHLYGIEKS